MANNITEVPGIDSGLARRLQTELGIQDAESLSALFDLPGMGENLATALALSPGGVADLEKAVRAVVVVPIQAPADLVLTLGAVQPPASEMPPPSAAPPPVGLPPATNLVPKFQAVRNQGYRGTCVAFAVAAQREVLATNKKVTLDASEQFLYEETKRIDGASGSCGTWQSKAGQVIHNLGVCRESVWPYNMNLPCNNNGAEPPGARTDAASYQAAMTVFNPHDVSTAKATLAAGMAVGLSIPVYNSWYTSAAVRQNGVLNMPIAGDSVVGGHAVCMAGYQDNGAYPGGGYFVFRNSWGTSWASQNQYGAGYGTIPYAYVATYAWELVTLN